MSKPALNYLPGPAVSAPPNRHPVIDAERIHDADGGAA
jgi:hypothetical protein